MTRIIGGLAGTGVAAFVIFVMPGDQGPLSLLLLVSCTALGQLIGKAADR